MRVSISLKSRSEVVLRCKKMLTEFVNYFPLSFATCCVLLWLLLLIRVGELLHRAVILQSEKILSDGILSQVIDGCFEVP